MDPPNLKDGNLPSHKGGNPPTQGWRLINLKDGGPPNAEYWDPPTLTMQIPKPKDIHNPEDGDSAHSKDGDPPAQEWRTSTERLPPAMRTKILPKSKDANPIFPNPREGNHSLEYRWL
ncbi:hypothetical protein WISP_92370 [Willisornis vidua]|uniref:Uncharacterized protein n=1 Tax=Willisornis vidua TaxID=1566151 RepID=A0ABQ9D178_9PASS|nr:hypothetical protein WISP_92370 [Willisornis vidua]